MSRKRSSKSVVTVSLTVRALLDLNDIEEYSRSHWGAKTTSRYLDDIATALELISESPDVLRREPDFSTDLFFYRVRKHYLVCDFREAKIFVVAIVHGSMDIQNRLAEIEPRLAAEIEFLHWRLRGE